MRVLVLSFICLQVADSFLTMWATGHGYEELNPVIAPIANTYWMPVIKIIPAILVGFLVLRLRFPESWKVAPKAIRLGLGGACGFLGIVLLSNILELIKEG